MTRTVQPHPPSARRSRRRGHRPDRIAAAPDATVTVGRLPSGVALTPSGSEAYVANEGSGTVSVIDTGTDTVTHTVTVGLDPFWVATTTAAAKAYVTNSGDGTVSVIDTTTKAVTGTIPVGSAPSGIAVTPDGLHAYATDSNDNTVSVIDTATDTVTSVIGVGPAPMGVALQFDGATAFVTNSEGNSVSLVRTSDNTVVDVVSVGSTPLGVATHPTQKIIYVANNDSDTVSVIDATTTPPTVQDIPVGPAPVTPVVAPDGAFLYVTNETIDEVSVIRTSDNAVLGTIPVGVLPYGATLSADSSTLYVSNNGDRSVTVTSTTPRLPDITTLTADHNPSVSGQPVTLTATVTTLVTAPPPPPLTGTVSFYDHDGALLLGSASVIGGSATLTTSDLLPGSHRMIAVYSGDQTYHGSVGRLTEMVTCPTRLAAAPAEICFDPDSLRCYIPELCAALTDQDGNGIPFQTVTFIADATVLGTATTDRDGHACLCDVAVQCSMINAVGYTVDFAGTCLMNGASATAPLTVSRPD